MFNIFKKKSNKKINKSNNKQDLEDFILILKQIQEINKKYTKKIEELDNANI